MNVEELLKLRERAVNAKINGWTTIFTPDDVLPLVYELLAKYHHNAIMVNEVVIVGCPAVSLKGHRCILDEGHAFGHEREDGRCWPPGQTWADVVEMFLRREGLVE